MVQQSSSSHNPSADFDNEVVPFPTRSAEYVPPVFPAQSAGQAVAAPKVRVRTHSIGQIVVLEVAGLLHEDVQDLDRAIQLALADGPRGVVCDLSIVVEGAGADAVEVLATAGRHVRDWPGIPLAVACPDPHVRKALCAHPLGGYLIVTASMLPAASAVLATSIPAVEWLRLAPHPSAPSASRTFVAHTLLDWGLGTLIPAASLVVSELVTNAMIHSGTEIALSVSWNLGGLRVTVRDHSPELPRQGFSKFDRRGRGLSVVASLSRAYGVLPTADGGKVAWAVLNAARPLPPTSPRSPELATTNQ